MFAAFEGIDGSGKSTAIAAVAARLQGEGTPVWATREETSGPHGKAVKASIAARADPEVTTLLFLADRRSHAKDIQRHLAAGDWVLCDRYMHSTLAYQGATLGTEAIPHLRDLHKGLPIPDRVLLFDIDAKAAVARAEGRGDTTPYEKVEFLEKVAANYRALAAAEPERFVVIDATQSPDNVAAAAYEALQD